MKIETEDQLRRLRRGDIARFRRKGNKLYESGMIRGVWTCLDVPCVDIIAEDGGFMSVMPELGDELIIQETTP